MALQKPRVKVPKSAKKGDTFQIKTMIKHDMESGLRKGKGGKIVPRKIINKFDVTFNGKPVFGMSLEGAVSASPYIAFFHRATESGEFKMTWSEETGESVSATKKITVS
ncbi:thiosulfate oxidation carrier complex protein SoxZ [Magnetospira sp. QH-2]|uniref:thiosulfate oxidation carrier complex protein SoxZ n=1 Tax=Magnetospira sp. (strain QH-2) TaxID=1288970 RepID=UPI0003E80A4B|nr:thiosulfate oxidation carrier complex protein SoxZ [Magnetospira sp. QH-2]CCQ73759.1 Sulfur oxidation protein SoxZ [Magnetospira sp. QH-2]